MAPGQIWRLCWNDECSIAVLHPRTDGNQLTAFPVSEDIQFATEHDLVLQSEESSLGMPLMIQVALEAGVGRFVLERCIGTLSNSAIEDLASLRATFAGGESSGLPLGRVGPPVTHELDERLQYRAAQRDMFAAFSFAQWLESVDDEVIAVGDLISEKISQSGRTIAIKEMNQATGISINDLVRLWRDEGAAVDDKQVAALADFLGADASSVIRSLSGEVPPPLIEVMDHPTQKPRFYRYSQEWQLDEAQTRSRVARTLVSAKRRAKQMSGLDWERQLEEHFPL